MIDLHCHILPGVDDGVRSVEEALALAAGAAREGVTAIAATPHVREDYPTTADEIDAAVASVRAHVAAAGIDVEILSGAEVDISWLDRLADDEIDRYTLAGGGRYLLLELPDNSWPLAFETTIARLASRGISALLAHPERNVDVRARPERLAAAVAAGALVQVTAAALDGRFGGRSAAAVRHLLERRLVHVLATDAHGPDVRAGGLAAAVDALADEGLARYLTHEAPAAIVAGERVPPPPERSRGRFRLRRR